MRRYIIRNAAHALLKKLIGRFPSYQTHGHHYHHKIETFFTFCRVVFHASVVWQIITKIDMMTPSMIERNTWEILGGFYDSKQRKSTTPPLLHPFKGDHQVICFLFQFIFFYLIFYFDCKDKFPQCKYYITKDFEIFISNKYQ